MTIGEAVFFDGMETFWRGKQRVMSLLMKEELGRVQVEREKRADGVLSLLTWREGADATKRRRMRDGDGGGRNLKAKGLKWGRSSRDRVVERCSQREKIVGIVPWDSEEDRRKVRAVEALMVRDLGSYKGSEEGRWAYLYVVDEVIVGCLFAERVQEAQRALNDEQSVACEVTQKVLLGVQMIWVLDGHRRRGIGSKLLNAARRNVVYGLVIPRELVAFTPTTTDGSNFARHYVAPHHVLVYKPGDSRR